MLRQSTMFEVGEPLPEAKPTDDEWLAAHGAVGILEPGDVADLTRAARRVLALMLGGKWVSATAIRKAAGDGREASEGLRRMRDLRPLCERRGWAIEKRRAAGGRLFEYRINKKPGAEE